MAWAALTVVEVSGPTMSATPLPISRQARMEETYVSTVSETPKTLCPVPLTLYDALVGSEVARVVLDGLDYDVFGENALVRGHHLQGQVRSLLHLIPLRWQEQT